MIILNSSNFAVYESPSPTLKETLEEAREKILKGIPYNHPIVGHMVINLIGAQLEGSDLEGANLSGINLNYANFRNCNLKGVNFTSTSLMGARFEGSDLTGADVTGAAYRATRPFNCAITTDLVGYKTPKLAKLTNGLLSTWGCEFKVSFTHWNERAALLAKVLKEGMLNDRQNAVLTSFLTVSKFTTEAIPAYYIALSFHVSRVANPKALERDLLKCLNEIIDNYQQID